MRMTGRLPLENAAESVNVGSEKTSLMTQSKQLLWQYIASNVHQCFISLRGQPHWYVGPAYTGLTLLFYGTAMDWWNR